MKGTIIKDKATGDNYIVLGEFQSRFILADSKNKDMFIVDLSFILDDCNFVFLPNNSNNRIEEKQ